jgi:hypothetical protein
MILPTRRGATSRRAIQKIIDKSAARWGVPREEIEAELPSILLEIISGILTHGTDEERRTLLRAIADCSKAERQHLLDALTGPSAHQA